MRVVLWMALVLSVGVVGCDGNKAETAAAGAAVDVAVKVRTVMSHPYYSKQPADAAYAEFQQAMSRAEREAAKSPALSPLRSCLSDITGMRADRASIDMNVSSIETEAASRFQEHAADLDKHIEQAKAALK